jgi:hypothetical protein
MSSTPSVFLVAAFVVLALWTRAALAACPAANEEFCALQCKACDLENGRPICTGAATTRQNQLCYSECITPPVGACVYGTDAKSASQQFLVYSMTCGQTSSVQCATLPYNTFYPTQGCDNLYDTSSHWACPLALEAIYDAVTTQHFCVNPDSFNYQFTSPVSTVTKIDMTNWRLPKVLGTDLSAPIKIVGIGSNGFWRTSLLDTDAQQLLQNRAGYSPSADYHDESPLLYSDPLFASLVPSWYDAFTGINIGLCAGPVCVGQFKRSVDLVTLPPNNDACQYGHCSMRVRREYIANNSDFDPADAKYWPPSGYPNLQQMSTLLELQLSTHAVTERDRCEFPSSCVSVAECHSSTCTAMTSSNEHCSFFSCRSCSRFSGTCTGLFDRDTKPCAQGCQQLGSGTCDSLGSCNGVTLSADQCLRENRVYVPSTDGGTGCYNSSCTPVIPEARAHPITFIPPQSEYTGSAFDEEVARAPMDVAAALLSDCAIQIATEGTSCVSSNSCVQDRTCSIEGLCTGGISLDGWCIMSSCRLCSNATGDCTGDVQADLRCVNACARSPDYLGACSVAGACVAAPADPTLCQSSSGYNVCNASSCVSSVSGTPVAFSETVLVTAQLMIANGLAVLSSCNTTTLPNGAFCQSSNLCAQSSTCQNGGCTVQTTVDCSSLVLSSSSCVNSSTLFCDTSTGTCRAQDLAVGSSCSDNNLCTVGDTCILSSFATNHTVCQPGTPIVCSTGGSPCVQSATCDPATGGCVLAPKAEGAACQLTTMIGGQCPQFGICNRGTCVPDPAFCAAPENPCLMATCDALTGTCTTAPRPAGSPCDDSDICTLNDICNVAGLCVGNARTCTPPNECVVSALVPCDPSYNTTNGCKFVPVPNMPQQSCASGFGNCSDGLCFLEDNCGLFGMPVVANGVKRCSCDAKHTGEFCEVEIVEASTIKTIKDTANKIKDAIVTYGLLFVTGFFIFIVLIQDYCAVRKIRIVYTPSGTA